jgi:hypothetical protein
VGLRDRNEDKVTDDELFNEFFQRVRDRSHSELNQDVWPALAPYSIAWGKEGEVFSFDPPEAHREGLDHWVDRAVARIRLSHQKEAEGS